MSRHERNLIHVIKRNKPMWEGTYSMILYDIWERQNYGDSKRLMIARDREKDE